jgi:hypothetical protein
MLWISSNGATDAAAPALYIAMRPTLLLISVRLPGSGSGSVGYLQRSTVSFMAVTTFIDPLRDFRRLPRLCLLRCASVRNSSTAGQARFVAAQLRDP